MHRWNKEYLQEIAMKDRKFKEFKCFCFNKANEIAGEMNLQWIVLQFYDKGFKQLSLQQTFECWCSFSKKYKEFNSTKVRFQDEFLRLDGYYISLFENLLLEELNCDSDYETEYEKEKEQIINYCFNKIITDLERRYEYYVGDKSRICIERI